MRASCPPPPKHQKKCQAIEDFTDFPFHPTPGSLRALEYIYLYVRVCVYIAHRFFFLKIGVKRLPAAIFSFFSYHYVFNITFSTIIGISPPPLLTDIDIMDTVGVLRVGHGGSRDRWLGYIIKGGGGILYICWFFFN